MSYRLAIAASLLLVACAPTPASSPSTPSKPASSTPASASPSPSASASPAIGVDDFVPGKFTLSIDGAPVEVQQRGNTVTMNPQLLTAYLGLFKGEKAGAREIYSPVINILTSGKAFSAPDFGKADVTSLQVGLNWTRNMTMRTYVMDSGATKEVSSAGGKLNVTYSGKMKRTTGTGEFPETIMVELAVEGIPPKP